MDELTVREELVRVNAAIGGWYATIALGQRLYVDQPHFSWVTDALVGPIIDELSPVIGGIARGLPE